MAAGRSADQMAEEYPGIQPEHLLAAAAVAADMLGDEEYVAIGKAKAA